MTAPTTQPTNRQIAERAGWRIEPLGKFVQEDWYAVYDAAGQPVCRQTSYSNNHHWPAYELDNALPAYLTDVNAALTLPLPPGLFFVLMVNQSGATCSISPRLGVVVGDVESAINPAEAVCAAWWALQMQQEDTR